MLIKKGLKAWILLIAVIIIILAILAFLAVQFIFIVLPLALLFIILRYVYLFFRKIKPEKKQKMDKKVIDADFKEVHDKK